VYQGLAWLRTDREATECSDGDTAAPRRVGTRAHAHQDNRDHQHGPRPPGHVAATTPSRHRRAERSSQDQSIGIPRAFSVLVASHGWMSAPAEAGFAEMGVGRGSEAGA
jgi:hypothetical protein